MTDELFEGIEEDGNGAAMMAAFGNFDVDSEYKAEPLIPNGTYSGTVKEVKADGKNCCIVWTAVLNNNDILASDGETSVDGMEVYVRNWLPKTGDENQFSKNGKVTKRQSKINMLKKFADKMKINMSTPQIIAQAISEGEWIGTEVILEIGVNEWKGDIRNEVNSMIAA